MAKKTHPKAKNVSAESQPAAGGELHQIAGESVPVLTTQQGTPVSDDQNSLKIGTRREKVHFTGPRSLVMSQLHS